MGKTRRSFWDGYSPGEFGNDGRDGQGKPPGYDYVSRRVGNEGGCAGHGKGVRVVTNRRERRRAKDELRRELNGETPE